MNSPGCAAAGPPAASPRPKTPRARRLGRLRSHRHTAQTTDKTHLHRIISSAAVCVHRERTLLAAVLTEVVNPQPHLLRDSSLLHELPQLVDLRHELLLGDVLDRNRRGDRA